MYRPTERNALVVDHYAKLGFHKAEGDASGLTRWSLMIDHADPETAPMNVVSTGFGMLAEALH